MEQTQFKIAVSVILLPIISLCFYFGLKELTMLEIVQLASDKCEDIPSTDSAKVYCFINYIDSYCDTNWKNKACHEYQMKTLKRVNFGE